MADYIQDQEKAWFQKFSPFISNGKIIKIGNGLGHLSEMIRPMASDLTILDIATYEETINKDFVQLYNGYPIPYGDKTFDTTVIVFTLHHIPNSKIFFDEIIRVTKNRIIIIEETYTNIFNKLHLYYRDWAVNKKAKQPCKLYWNSYFSQKELSKLISDKKLIETYKITKKHKAYFKELLVLDIQD